MKIKIRNKFSLSIILIVTAIFLIGILANSLFLERFYIHEQKKILDSAAKEISAMSQENIESQFAISMVSTEVDEELNKVNEALLWKFEQKKIKLNRFWITQDTLDTLQEKSVYKIYDQGHSQFKILTKFVLQENNLFAIVKPMPAMSETINIVNKFNIILMGISALLIVVILWILSKIVITKPLDALKDLSQDIANLKFGKVEIHTNDEMGQLSKSINKMSEDLERAYNESNEKNIRLKELLSSVSHELKTPLSLIKAYEQGKLDGLDDGNYDSIIEEQLDRMELLIEKLLFWVRIDGGALTLTEFDFREKIECCLKKYQLVFTENHIKTNFIVKGDSWLVCADEQSMEIVLDNLITNAIKYTSNKKLNIQLKKKDSKVELSMINGAENLTKSNLEQIWTPFFVFEKSRNKELSGTGLGLSIVKSILEAHNFAFGFSMEDKELVFCVTFL